MEPKLDTTASLFDRLATLNASQFARSSTFGREVVDACLVEIHILDRGRLRLIDRAGPAISQIDIVGDLHAELAGARDVLVRPVAETAGTDLAAIGAHMPIHLGNGDLAGCYSAYFPEQRGEIGAVERRALREIARFLASFIESAGRALPARTRDLLGIASSCADGIIVADRDGLVIAWNAGAEKLSGFGAEEIIGRPLGRLLRTEAGKPDPLGIDGWVRGASQGLPERVVEHTILRKDGTLGTAEVSFSCWREGDEPRLGAIVRDTSERRLLEDRLLNAASIDHLTGLANRASLDRQLAQLLEAGRRVTLLLIDLDGFKEVNDTLGHMAGDMVLAEVASRLRRHAGPSHFVARMGGDEFVVLMPDIANPLEGDWLGETLIDAIEEAITVDDAMVSISASIGIDFSTGGVSLESMLGNADLALYQAKRGGRGRAQLFTPDLRQRIVEKGLARTELAKAWEKGQFALYYQPQIRLADGVLSGAEALIRWAHPTRGVLAPGAFLPLLEADSLAVSVGGWIIDEACRQTAEWRATAFPGFTVAVNLFSLQFKSGDIVQEVTRALERHALDPSALELEITENTILKSDDRILRQLRRLRDLGVGLAFDDFGTGFASLSMLRQYPVSKIKIDRSFVSGADVCEKDRAITQALVHMADGLGIKVVAEGIETMEHHALMRSQGCDFGQGYLYSRPVPAHTFRALSCSGGQSRRAG